MRNIIKVGDVIKVSLTPEEDTELYDWLCDYKKDLVVTCVEEDTQMVWIKDCEYGISMEFVI